MNSHKSDLRRVNFEQSLGLMLKKWAQKYGPARSSRARLMKAAHEIQLSRLRGWQDHYRLSEAQRGENSFLFFSIHMSNMMAWLKF